MATGLLIMTLPFAPNVGKPLLKKNFLGKKERFSRTRKGPELAYLVPREGFPINDGRLVLLGARKI